MNRAKRKGRFSGDFAAMHKGLTKQEDDEPTQDVVAVDLLVNEEDDELVEETVEEEEEMEDSLVEEANGGVVMEDEYVDVGHDQPVESIHEFGLDDDVLIQHHQTQQQALNESTQRESGVARHDTDTLARIKELEKEERRAMEFHWPTPRADEHDCVWLDMPFINSAIAARLLLHAMQDPGFVTTKIPKNHSLDCSSGFIFNMNEQLVGTNKTPEQFLMHDAACNTITLWDRYNVRKKETYRTNEQGELEQCLSTGPPEGGYDSAVRSEYFTGGVGARVPPGFDQGHICVESTRRKAVAESGLCRMVFNMYQIETLDDQTRVLKAYPDFTFIYYRWYVTPHDIEECDGLINASLLTRKFAHRRIAAPLPSARAWATKSVASEEEFAPGMWQVADNQEDASLLRSIRAMERMENAPAPRIDESGVTWLDLPFINRFSAIKIMLKAMEDNSLITHLIPYTFPMSCSGYLVDLREMGDILKLESASKLLQEISLDNVGHWMRYNSYKKETFKINEAECLEQCFADGLPEKSVKRSFFTGTDVIPPGFSQGTIGLETRRRHAFTEKGLVKVVYTMHEIWEDEQGVRRLCDPHMAFVFYRWYVTPREIPPSLYGQGPETNRRSEKRRSVEAKPYCRKSVIVRREARALLEIGATPEVTYNHLKKMIPTNNPCFEFDVRTVHNEGRHFSGLARSRGRPKKYVMEKEARDPRRYRSEWQFVEDVEATAAMQADDVHTHMVAEEDEPGTSTSSDAALGLRTQTIQPRPIPEDVSSEIQKVVSSKLKRQLADMRGQMTEYLMSTHPELFEGSGEDNDEQLNQTIDQLINDSYTQITKSSDSPSPSKRSPTKRTKPSEASGSADKPDDDDEQQLVDQPGPSSQTTSVCTSRLKQRVPKSESSSPSVQHDKPQARPVTWSAANPSYQDIDMRGSVTYALLDIVYSADHT